MKTIRILLFLALHGSALRAQPVEYWLTRSHELFDADRYRLALKAAQEALNRLQDLPPGLRKDTLAMIIHCQTGDCLLALALFPEALGQFKKGFEYSRHTGDSLQIALVFHKMGNYFSRLGNTQAAIDHFQKALRIRRKFLGETHPLIADTYHNLGNCYLDCGDFAAALDYHFQALHIRESVFRGRPDVALAYSQINIGNCFYSLQETDRALDYYRQADNILGKTRGKHAVIRAGLWDNIGNCYVARQTYDKAEAAYRSAYRQLVRIFGPAHPETAKALNNLGNFYRAIKQYKAAITYHRQALAIRQKGSGESAAAGASWVNLATCFLESGHPDSAMNAIDRARVAFGYTSGKPAATPHAVITALFVQATIYESMGGDGGLRIEFLLSALQCYRDITTLIDELTDSYLDPGSTERLVAGSRYYLEKAIALCHALAQAGMPHFEQEAYYFFEKSRALILREAVTRSRASVFAGVPAELIGQEKELVGRIEASRRQLEHLELRGQQEEAEALRTRIFRLNEERQTVLSRIKGINAAYFNMRHDSGLKRPLTVQNSLESNQALLMYFMGEEHRFALVIQKQQVFLVALDTGFDLVGLITQLNENLASGSTDISSVAMYTQAAYTLYNRLVLPLKPLLKQKLVIVPDGILGHLSFDLLLTTPHKPANGAPDFRNEFHYLLFDHNISYCYSAGLLQEMQHRPYLPAAKKLLAIAPVFDQNDRKEGLAPLFLNTDEAKIALGVIGAGDILRGQQANKAALLNIIGNYQILHFSTHGQADSWDGRQSFLALSAGEGSAPADRHLYAGDLYGLSLRADLVVLSACETAVGEFQPGEGIISLARGFAYAGSGSILTALWPVQEYAIGDILRRFYTNLKKGKSIDVSLWEAKKTYIRETSDPTQAHPFFWGGLIPLGDMTPVFPCDIWLPALAVMLGVLGIAGLISWKRRKHHKIHL